MSSVSASKPILRLQGISKSFGPVKVLSEVSLELFGGEVHVLAGENGAGKSTLIKILGGVYSDYEGRMEVDGREVALKSPEQAADLGIAIIHQELSLIGSMSVVDNLFLGSEMTASGGWVRRAQERSRAREICASVGLAVDVDRPVEELSLAAQNGIEIGKALSRRPRVVVMDEPTSALTDPEVKQLFNLIADLKRQGCAIVYISHKMEEIYQLADRITVLRDGGWIGTRLAAELPVSDLIQWMIGRPLLTEAPRAEVVNSGVESLRVENWSVGPSVQDVSFSLRAGEVLGIAGLQGSGNSALLQSIFSGERSSGRVWLGGRPLDPISPHNSLENGLAYLSPDRKGSGLVLGMSVRENVTLAALADFSLWGFGGWLDFKAERASCRMHVTQFGIRCASFEQEVGSLSGGNQQKVALAKCIETAPQVLLLDEPTRGVDIGAKAEIYALIRKWTAQGMAIVLVSSELPELLSLADRVLVMHRGRLSGEFDRPQATQARILSAAMGEAIA